MTPETITLGQAGGLARKPVIARAGSGALACAVLLVLIGFGATSNRGKTPGSEVVADYRGTYRR